jgi:hypothetical protein
MVTPQATNILQLTRLHSWKMKRWVKKFLAPAA